jgi:thiol-disulfide isomerase/thioredoxin
MGLLAKIFGPGAPKVMPVHVDDSNFVEEVRRSKVPVVLDVWSPGCGPCKMMEPSSCRSPPGTREGSRLRS